MIWDDHQAKCIGELSFRSQVRSPLRSQQGSGTCSSTEALVPSKAVRLATSARFRHVKFAWHACRSELCGCDATVWS